MSLIAAPAPNAQPLPQICVYEDEEEYNEVIDQIVKLALTSENPEKLYQHISALHFLNNRPVEALKIVELVEEWANKNETAPLSIYGALFQRAKYYLFCGNASDLETAKDDLTKMLALNKIPDPDKTHICRLHDQISLLYTKDLKNIFNRNLGYMPVYIKEPDEPEEDICKEYDRAIQTYDFILANKDDGILFDLGSKITKAAFDKIIVSGKSSKSILETCLLYRACTHFRFKYYLSTAEDLEKLLILTPDHQIALDFKKTLESDLLQMNAKNRLAWIDHSLQVRKNDPNLLLWKAEAHFQLNQIHYGRKTAEILLGIIDAGHPHYESVLKMANASCVNPVTNNFI